MSSNKYQPGEWIQTDVNGRVLYRGMSAPANGLGMVYRANGKGQLVRKLGL